MRAFMAHTSGMLSTLQAQFMKLVASAALPPPPATGPGLPAGGPAASPARAPCAAAAGSERSLGDARGASAAPACAAGGAAPACAAGAAGARGAGAPAAREPLAERAAGAAGVEAPELPRAGPRPAPYGGLRGPAAPAAARAPGRRATRPAPAKENAGAARGAAAEPGGCGAWDGCMAWGVSAPSAGLRSAGEAWRDGGGGGAAPTRAASTPGAAQLSGAAPSGRVQSPLGGLACQQAREEPRARAPAGAAGPAVWTRAAAAAEADEHVWPCDALC